MGFLVRHLCFDGISVFFGKYHIVFAEKLFFASQCNEGL
jgi:hypothetical protein